jgi:ubiquinone/menaquinone biosynthesis C-methylase UbiE
MRYEEIFRNTKNWYLSQSNCASESLINFAVMHAGDTMLDAGCATGDYIQRLGELGYHCVGVDINSEYIDKAKQKGLDAHVMDLKHLEFPDKSFDTILLFEVLEHVAKPEEVIKEANRVARKNVLITVPNCTQFHMLRDVGLTFEHMLEKDHVNFFTKSDLENLLSNCFTKFNVIEAEPIWPYNLHPWYVRPVLYRLVKLGVIKPSIYYRLYAAADV